jgi:hypothetical protein
MEQFKKTTYLSGLRRGILTREPKRSYSSFSNSLRLWKWELWWFGAFKEPETDWRDMYIPCPRIGGKTLAKHSPRWVMPYPDFPLKLKASKCQAFHNIYASDNYTFALWLHTGWLTRWRTRNMKTARASSENGFEFVPAKSRNQNKSYTTWSP